MNERDLEKLSKVDLIKMVQKLQKKARKPKIAIADNNYKQVPQPIAKSQKAPRRIPPRDPKTGRFVKINPDRPKSPKQPALSRLKDAKGELISRRQPEPVVQKPIQILENRKVQKPIKRPLRLKCICIEIVINFLLAIMKGG